MESPMPATAMQVPTPWMTRSVAWLLVLLLGVQFVQLTLVQPADVQVALGFRRGDLDDGRWWSVATYMLVHGSLSLTLLNAYALALFGPRLERFWGARRFLVFIGLATIAGWMVHLFIGGEAPLVGASSAIFGVLAAYAMRWGSEEQRVAGGFTVRAFWLAVMVGSIILLVGLQESVGGGIAFVAHLSGMAAAWFFMRATKVLFVERFREGVSAVPDEPPEDQLPRAVPKTLPRSRTRDRENETIDDVVARSNAAASQRSSGTRRRATAEPGTAAPPALDIDTILDKISAHGIDHLTPDERRVLDDHSRRLRDG